MKINRLATVCFAFMFCIGNTFAAEGKVTISSPENGAAFGQHDNVVLKYETIPGPDGDHLHLYLDGKRVDVIHQLKGNANVGMLEVGKHHICLEVNTKGHVPTGAEACVDVISK
jgi:hypothetical protein